MNKSVRRLLKDDKHKKIRQVGWSIPSWQIDLALAPELEDEKDPDTFCKVAMGLFC